MTGKAEFEAAVARVAHFTKDEDVIRKQLEVILESQVFKGSKRSQDFLRFVVEKSLQGSFDDLKERILGIELFGRPVNYDTSQDAIVRVTANDVRKRLAQYYAKVKPDEEFRIDLPSGSYIPEFSRQAAKHELGAELLAIEPHVPPANQPVRHRNWIHLPAYVAALLGTACSIFLWTQKLHRTLPSPPLTQPWSSVFKDGHQPQLIFCDTSIQMLQDFLRTHISLSDYATRKFIPKSRMFNPETTRAASLLAGPDFTVTAAPVDLRIASRISEMAAARAYRIRLRSARELQFRDFKTESDFIILGSPRSNPWTALFDDQLDFIFSPVPGQQREICRNVHAKPGELPEYVPTAVGGATGEAYAIAAFLQNPDQNGHVIILAGSNAEGTEAAAGFMTNIELLTKTLRAHGIDPTAAPVHFEALLRLTTMAGSPNRSQVIALHRL